MLEDKRKIFRRDLMNPAIFEHDVSIVENKGTLE
jgi:hypothetical protein